jgi:hypothetical protein
VLLVAALTLPGCAAEPGEDPERDSEAAQRTDDDAPRLCKTGGITVGAVKYHYAFIQHGRAEAAILVERAGKTCLAWSGSMSPWRESWRAQTHTGLLTVDPDPYQIDHSGGASGALLSCEIAGTGSSTQTEAFEKFKQHDRCRP